MPTTKICFIWRIHPDADNNRMLPLIWIITNVFTNAHIDLGMTSTVSKIIP
jgi:hypothetical protein